MRASTGALRARAPCDSAPAALLATIASMTLYGCADIPSGRTEQPVLPVADSLLADQNWRVSRMNPPLGHALVVDYQQEADQREEKSCAQRHERRLQRTRRTARTGRRCQPDPVPHAASVGLELRRCRMREVWRCLCRGQPRRPSRSSNSTGSGDVLPRWRPAPLHPDLVRAARSGTRSRPGRTAADVEPCRGGSARLGKWPSERCGPRCWKASAK